MAENRWLISSVLNQWIDPVEHPNGIQQSATPQYLSFASNAVSVNEDGLTAVIFTVNTSNVADGTTIGYTISGVSVEDISLSSLTGTITIASDMGTVQFTMVADQTTEGSETIVVTLDAVDSEGTETNSPNVSVIVNDTSVEPITTLVPSSTTMNEGDTITFTFTTNEYPDGTYYWGKGSPAQNIEDVDIVQDIPYYNYTPNAFTVTNGVGTFDVTAVADYITDGTESFRLIVSDGINYGYTTIIKQSVFVTVVDSTIYDSLVASSSSVNEGDVVTYTYTTQRPDGTYYFGRRVGDTSEPEDTNPQLASYQFDNSFEVVGGVGTFQVGIVADYFTDGTETLTVAVASQSGYTTDTNRFTTITINDTSINDSLTSSTSTANEGDTVTYTYTTQRPDGTYYFASHPGDTSEPEDTDPQLTSYQFDNSFEVVGGVGTFDVVIVADQQTEGTEYLTVVVSDQSGYYSGWNALSTIEIVDTSLTPPVVVMPTSYQVQSYAPAVGTVSITFNNDGTTSIDSTNNSAGVGEDWLAVTGTNYYSEYEYFVTRSSPSVNFNFSGATLNQWTDIGVGALTLSLTGPQNGATVANETINVQIRQKGNVSNIDSTNVIFSYNIGEQP